jgi:8-oxo-dGTP diphosphatase
MKKRTRKVLAYIVRDGELLVFIHVHAPDAGVQVPAGTVRDGEEPAMAVLREVAEESGLTDINLVRLLGVYDYDMAAYGRDEIQERYVFELRPRGKVPREWVHYEQHDGLARPDQFSFFWLALSEAIATGLEAGQGDLLPRLAAPARSSLPEIRLP